MKIDKEAIKERIARIDKNIIYAQGIIDSKGNSFLGARIDQAALQAEKRALIVIMNAIRD